MEVKKGEEWLRGTTANMSPNHSSGRVQYNPQIEDTISTEQEFASLENPRSLTVAQSILHCNFYVSSFAILILFNCFIFTFKI